MKFPGQYPGTWATSGRVMGYQRPGHGLPAAAVSPGSSPLIGATRTHVPVSISQFTHISMVIIPVFNQGKIIDAHMMIIGIYSI
jgi:hypothetical protein